MTFYYLISFTICQQKKKFQDDRLDVYFINLTFFQSVHGQVV